MLKHWLSATWACHQKRSICSASTWMHWCKAPADFGRAISALRQVADISSPSQADAAYAVNVVDLIAELAQRPQLPAPIQKLWAVEKGIRTAGGLWTLKHLVTIALAFAGVLVVALKS